MKQKIKIVDKGKKKRGRKKKKEVEIEDKKPSVLDKFLKLSVIFVVIIVAISILYYFFIFLPKAELPKENISENIEPEAEALKEEKKPIEGVQVKGTEDNLDDCLTQARQTYFEVFKEGLGACKDIDDIQLKNDCVEKLLEDIEQGLEMAEAECF